MIVEAGPGAGRQIRIGDALVIGREADGEGRLDADPEVSRRHARVWRDPDGTLFVEDLDSANGTRLNGEVLAPRVRRPLGAADRLGIGTTVLRLEQSASATAVPEVESTLETKLPAAASSPAEQRGSPSAIRPVPSPDAPGPAAVSQAEVLHGGTRMLIPPGGLRLGRDPSNDLVLSSLTLSREHAVIAAAEGRYFVEDLGTRNGTALNGERLRGESRWLNSGDTIELGARRCASSPARAPRSGASPLWRPRTSPG